MSGLIIMSRTSLFLNLFKLFLLHHHDVAQDLQVLQLLADAATTVRTSLVHYRPSRPRTPPSGLRCADPTEGYWGYYEPISFFPLLSFL